MNIDMTLHIVFAAHVAGETTASHENLCWVTKTHWPMESSSGVEKFGTQRCFSVVRNPIDTLVSLSYLTTTSSHSMVTKVPLSEADPDWWNNYVKASSKAINESTKCMRLQVQPEIPTYFIRYEDLVLDPEPVLNELFAFMLAVESIDGTVV